MLCLGQREAGGDEPGGVARFSLLTFFDDALLHSHSSPPTEFGLLIPHRSNLSYEDAMNRRSHLIARSVHFWLVLFPLANFSSKGTSAATASSADISAQGDIAVWQQGLTLAIQVNANKPMASI